MTYTFTVTVQDVVGFLNPLIVATLSKDDEVILRKQKLDRPFPSDDIGNNLRGILDDMFPKKSAPVNTEGEVKKPSSQTRRKKTND